MIDEFFAYREPAAVGVSFRRSGKVYYFAPNGLRVRQGDQVLAQTDKGIDIGEVVFIKYELHENEPDRQLKPLLRKATPEDLAHEQELQQKEREARKLCEDKIVEHKLPMRLIAADYTFDGQRLVFFFSAEGRVDFRNLVRDLAETFHTRIELRQVGVRDQAKMIGGLGPCGRPLCCNAFLRNFDPVGIRVAKDQGLSLNPAKISGICDRLMCCLKYEHETYLELAKKLPRPGQIVQTHKGPAEVRNVNLMHERLHVRYPDDTTDDLKASQVWRADEEAPPIEAAPGADEDFAPADTPAPVMRQRSPQATPQERSERSRRQAFQSRPAPPAPPAAPARPAEAPAEAPAAPAEAGQEDQPGGTRRRRRRRPDSRKPRPEGEAGAAPAPGQPQPQSQAPAPPQPQAQGQPGQPAGEAGGAPKRKRRPRFRRRPDTKPEQG